MSSRQLRALIVLFPSSLVPGSWRSFSRRVLLPVEEGLEMEEEDQVPRRRGREGANQTHPQLTYTLQTMWVTQLHARCVWWVWVLFMHTAPLLLCKIWLHAICISITKWNVARKQSDTSALESHLMFQLSCTLHVCECSHLQVYCQCLSFMSDHGM